MVLKTVFNRISIIVHLPTVTDPVRKREKEKTLLLFPYGLYPFRKRIPRFLTDLKFSIWTSLIFVQVLNSHMISRFTTKNTLQNIVAKNVFKAVILFLIKKKEKTSFAWGYNTLRFDQEVPPKLRQFEKRFQNHYALRVDCLTELVIHVISEV